MLTGDGLLNYIILFEDINECDSNPCSHGTCHDLANGFFCACMDGYTGHRCHTPIDPCASNPCKNGGTCVKDGNGFTCQCPPNVQGRQCQGSKSICKYKPCKAGGTCQPTNGGFECRCPPGHVGQTCEKDINECLQRPCKNNGHCIDGDGMYSCQCMVGFVGVNYVDECLSNPCGSTALCVNLRGSYECVCEEGYEGDQCERTTDLCLLNPCMNGGTCISKKGSKKFSCSSIDYRHRQINNYFQQEVLALIWALLLLCNVFGKATSACAQNPCMFGKCQYKDGNPFCMCDQGFTGKRCDMRIDFCKGVTCGRNARCISSLEGHHCNCKPGFTGSNCEINYVGACKRPEVCVNGGTCEVKGDTFECKCPEKFIGETCEISLTRSKTGEAENSEGNLSQLAVVIASVFTGLAAFSFAVAAWMLTVGLTIYCYYN
ncbi:EGF-like domain protein [Trichuris suis]|nr:EGF-like domain protein [Trichuris suis]